MSSSNVDWNDLLKKEARCINGEDLGEVQDVDERYVLTQKGMLNKKEGSIFHDI
jgi:sporulation protein YlmC with PRC-barrel domain